MHQLLNPRPLTTPQVCRYLLARRSRLRRQMMPALSHNPSRCNPQCVIIRLCTRSGKLRRWKRCKSTRCSRLSCCITAACAGSGHQHEAVPRSIFEAHIPQNGNRQEKLLSTSALHMPVTSQALRVAPSVWHPNLRIKGLPGPMLRTVRSSFRSCSYESLVSRALSQRRERHITLCSKLGTRSLLPLRCQCSQDPLMKEPVPPSALLYLCSNTA